MEKNQGYIPCILVMLMMRNELPVQIRQGAVLRLKSLVKYGWYGRKAQNIAQQDRMSLHQKLIEVICTETEWLIRVQLLEVLFQILRCDYPRDWPTAFDQIMAALRSANSAESMFGAVSCFNVICKVFRHAGNKDDKNQMNNFISSGMPIIFPILQSVIHQNTPFANEFSKIVLKAFSYAIQVSVPDYFKAWENMDQWVALLLTVAKSPLDASLIAIVSQDPDQLRTHASIKLRKWSLKILSRILAGQIHIRTTEALKKKHNAWIKAWAERYGSSLLSVVVEIVKSGKEGHPVAPKVWLQCFDILKSSVLKLALYNAMIKPNMSIFIESAVFPTLVLTPGDLQVWQEDPHGFVAQTLNPLSTMGDHRYAAERFLEHLVKSRTKTALPLVLSFVQKVLTSYQTAGDATKPSLVLSKDAALRMLACIKKHIITANPKMIEEIIVHHIFPEFSSANIAQSGGNPPVLVVRGLAFIAAFTKCKFSSPDILLKTVEFSCSCLGAADLTLRVEAGQTLGKLVRNSSIREALRPNLGALFQQLLSLINEVSNETLGLLFRDLLEHFAEDLAPFADGLVSHLVPMFIQCASQDGDDDETEEALLAASQYLASIVGIVMSLEEAPAQMVQRMEQLCEPMVTFVLKNEGIDYIDGILELFQCFTYYPEVISDYTWANYPLLIQASLTWATDYMENFSGPFVNYFSNNIDNFYARPEYVNMMLSVPVQFFADNDRSSDASFVAHILRTLLGYTTKGQLDSQYPQLMKLLLDKLVNSDNTYLRLLCLDCLCAMLHNSLQAFMSTLISMNSLDIFFNHWFSLIDNMKDQDRVIYTVHALSKLIETVPAAQMPPSLQNQMRVVVGKLLGAMLQLKDITERRKLETDEVDDDDEEGDIFDAPSDFELDDENEKADDANTMQVSLEKLSAEARAELTGDREEFGSAWEAYSTPIDDINPFTHFLNALQVFRERDGANYADFVQSVFDPNSVTNELFKFAQTSAVEFDTPEEEEKDQDE